MIVPRLILAFHIITRKRLPTSVSRVEFNLFHFWDPSLYRQALSDSTANSDNMCLSHIHPLKMRNS